MCDFLNPKTVTIGFGIDQNKKSICPIGQKYHFNSVISHVKWAFYDLINQVFLEQLTWRYKSHISLRSVFFGNILDLQIQSALVKTFMSPIFGHPVPERRKMHIVKNRIRWAGNGCNQ